ncbi:MAG: cytochrome c [Acidobacteriia bacterium]|nr:cytochrome c [Terriglobia bacterium]
MRVSILTLLVWLATAGVSSFAQQKPIIKHVPPDSTDVASGEEMFRTYCAVCHGVDGRGAGPAAPALNQGLPDLTQISQRNGGKFPGFRIANIIQGDVYIAAHGSRDMPTWGDVFRSMKRDEATVKLRVHNLTHYLRSLQQK